MATKVQKKHIGGGEDHPVCIKCKLHERCRHPFMPTSGSESPRILIVGEAPGHEEDRTGVQFVGESGRLLRSVLKNIDIDEDDVAFTNIVRCRPPDNKVQATHIKYCAEFTLQEIEELNPDVVLLMGNSPLSGVLGQRGITTWHGVSIEKNGRKYIPMYHPAYVLRNESVMDDWLGAFLNIFSDDEDGSDMQHIFPETVKDVMEMMKYLSQYDKISYDTETATLDAYDSSAAVLVVSFAAGDRAYALPIEHPDAAWSDSELDVVRKAICDILQEHDGKIIGHNTKYDLVHTFAYFGVQVEMSDDTMLISHLIDSRKGIHGLKRLAGLHLGMYEYDAKLDEYKKTHPECDPERELKIVHDDIDPLTGKKRVQYISGSYRNIPLDVLLPYAAKDAEATLKLLPILHQELSDKQKILYEQVVIPVSNTLTRIRIAGIAVDEYIAMRYLHIYKKVQHDVYMEILKDKYVKKMTRMYRKGVANSKGRIVVNKSWMFNPNSSMQVAKLLFGMYKLPVIEHTDTGNPSTDKNTMKIYAADYPIVRNIRYYKLLSKMIGTYLRPAATGVWISKKDRKVRGEIGQHFTRTGRTASRNPNLQNIPTPEKEPGTLLETLPIKNIFTHSYGGDNKYNGGVLMSVDYSGMELRVFSALANCKAMIKIHKSGKDFHSMVAIMSMTHKDVRKITDEEISKLQRSVRYVYKWTNWTLLYGGGAATLHRMYGVPIEEAEETVETYYNVFPEVLDYKDDCESFTREHGYIESPFGRREHLPDIYDERKNFQNKAVREAVNMPVQSAASEITLMALAIIDRELHKRQLRTRIVNTVHDSIVLDVPTDEIDTVANLCVDVMENIRKWARIYMPDVDMRWLRDVPLKADVEVGTHYGCEMDIEQWREHVADNTIFR